MSISLVIPHLFDHRQLHERTITRAGRVEISLAWLRGILDTRAASSDLAVTTTTFETQLIWRFRELADCRRP
jgi:hypothetical protein